MKFFLLLALSASFVITSCKTTRAINKVIAAKDSVVVLESNVVTKDSLMLVETTTKNLEKNFIDFKTFSAKIKVDVEDAKGKQP
ncbi:MAG: hypothetical protein H7Y07_13330, partial [Pyrinomonadaceae bacterium]|nr:hypothetical protein [Sphingobacteriaceae bacterium]